MAHKITKYSSKNVIQAKTQATQNAKSADAKWWLMDKESELCDSIFSVVQYIKENQNWRQNQAAIFARLYGNLPIWNFMGANLTKLNSPGRFPAERPTLNVVQSCVDALVSRMVQSKPKPMFLTEGGNYKNRKLSKKLNKLIDGEFYRCKAYEQGENILRDSCILGDGLLKVYEADDGKVALERVLDTEIFVDDVDGMYGKPQQLHQLKCVDRSVLAEMYPEKRGRIETAPAAYLDASSYSNESVVSQVMVAESWRLPSCEGANDGKHTIVIANAKLFGEDWEDNDFPFVKFPYAPRTLGYWAQGLAEQLMGTQAEINRLLYVIQTSLHLCGIPKWLVESGSKVVSAHVNNQIGGIIKYQGVAPVLQAFSVLPPELYAQLERLVQYAYQQSGISQLSAASKKPEGLNSGAALREYDDIQSDRFAYLGQRWERFYLELAQKQMDCIKRIAKRDKEYRSVTPDKDSYVETVLTYEELKDKEYLIQAYPASALAKNPAQRKQEIIDLMQGGLIDPDEGRRLLDFPDLQQVEDLKNAAEERILKILDEIIEDGIYTPPDPFMPVQKAKQLVVEYLNKFLQEDLEESKAQMLRDFSVQVDVMIAAAMPPAPMGGEGLTPANPMPTPVSPLVPNVNAA